MLKQVTQSDTLALSLAEAKAHLRIDDDAEDAYVTDLITRATELIESETNVDIRATTWDMVLPKLDSVTIPRGPLVSVESITYYDANNTEQTLATSEYYVMTPARTLGWVVIPDHKYFSVYDRPDAVTIRFVSGYTATPQIVKHAICLLIGNWFENREGVITGTIATELPLGVQRLLNQITVGV